MKIDKPITEPAFMSLRDYASLQILSAMITSAPVADRTKVDKQKWARLSLEWADIWLAEQGREV